MKSSKRRLAQYTIHAETPYGRVYCVPNQQWKPAVQAAARWMLSFSVPYLDTKMPGTATVTEE